MKSANELIGKTVTIKCGMYKGEWGVIKYYDGEHFHVALWNGTSQLVFGRDEFTLQKAKKTAKSVKK